MKFINRLFVVVAVLFLSQFAFASEEAEQLNAEEQEYVQWAQGIMQKLNPKTGLIALPNGIAELNVPDTFYYLDPAEAELVLTEVWGNPPGQKTQGMLFPAGTTPFDSNAWAVTIDYENEGHVKDEDASEINYDDLLVSMQDDTKAANKERVKMGYESIELVGWAAKPYYDQSSRKLHWAKELKFGDNPSNTLNYGIRVLGREGVLVLNFIADMSQLAEINQNLDQVLTVASFKNGHQYDDFDPSVDKVAAYGIGALIAGKVLAKTGFFAVILLFLKKFWFVALLAIGGAFNFIKSKIFSKQDNTTHA